MLLRFGYLVKIAHPKIETFDIRNVANSLFENSIRIERHRFMQESTHGDNRSAHMLSCRTIFQPQSL